MIGLDQSAIPRKKSETGASGFGSNFFREEGEGSVFGKRSYIKDKIMPMPSVDNIEYFFYKNILERKLTLKRKKKVKN